MTVESALFILSGAVLGPIVTHFLKRLAWVDPKLGAAINVLATLALYLGAWSLWTGGDRAQIGSYITWALASAGLGGGANNYYRRRMME